MMSHHRYCPRSPPISLILVLDRFSLRRAGRAVRDPVQGLHLRDALRRPLLRRQRQPRLPHPRPYGSPPADRSPRHPGHPVAGTRSYPSPHRRRDSGPYRRAHHDGPDPVTYPCPIHPGAPGAGRHRLSDGCARAGHAVSRRPPDPRARDPGPGVGDHRPGACDRGSVGNDPGARHDRDDFGPPVREDGCASRHAGAGGPRNGFAGGEGGLRLRLRQDADPHGHGAPDAGRRADDDRPPAGGGRAYHARGHQFPVSQRCFLCLVTLLSFFVGIFFRRRCSPLRGVWAKGCFWPLPLCSCVLLAASSTKLRSFNRSFVCTTLAVAVGYWSHGPTISPRS